MKPEKKIERIKKVELTEEEKKINLQKFKEFGEKLKKLSEDSTLKME